MPKPPRQPAAARSKPRVHRELVKALARRIVNGEFQPGSTLPPETTICEQLGVSRTAWREACKVLESKGMLKSRMRLGTLVQEQRCWNLLDPDLLDWCRDAVFSAEFVESLMEARRVLEPAAAEMAARRATGQDLAALESAYLRMCDSLPERVEDFCDADLDFHSALLIASHNLIFAQLVSTIRAALRALFEHTLQLGRPYEQALEKHAQIIEAIRLRDPATARQVSAALLEQTTRDIQAGPTKS